MPQSGRGPAPSGPPWVIGQTNSTRSPGMRQRSAAGAGGGPESSAGPPSSESRGPRCGIAPAVQKPYVFPPCSCEPPRAVAGSTFIPHTGSVASFTEPGAPEGYLHRPPSWSLRQSEKRPHHIEEFVHARLLLDRVAAADGLGHAVLDVLAQDGLLDPPERGPRARACVRILPRSSASSPPSDEASDLAPRCAGASRAVRCAAHERASWPLLYPGIVLVPHGSRRWRGRSVYLLEGVGDVDPTA